MTHQCRACQHRINTGEVAWGRPVVDCALNLRPPARRVCPLFCLDEGSEMMEGNG